MKWLIILFIFLFSTLAYSIDKIDFENTTIKVISKVIEVKPNDYRMCNFQIRVNKPPIPNNIILNKKIYIQQGTSHNMLIFSNENFKASIKLYDLFGNLIKSIDIDLIGGCNNVSLETANLYKGLYFLFVENKNIILEKQMLFIK